MHHSIWNLNDKNLQIKTDTKSKDITRYFEKGLFEYFFKYLYFIIV